MYKLRMLVLTALAVAMVGGGALATAPSASAMPSLYAIACEEMKGEYLHWVDAANTAERLFGRDYYLTKLYRLRAAKEYNDYSHFCL
jgi:hypothetical protein